MRSDFRKGQLSRRDDCVESCEKVEQGNLLAGQTPNKVTRSRKDIN